MRDPSWLLAGVLVAMVHAAGAAHAAEGQSIQQTATDYHYVRMPAASADALTRSSVQPRTMIDYGSFLWLEVSRDDLARLNRAGIESREEINAFTLRLGEQSFDPVKHQPVLPPGLDAVRAVGPELHLVQMVGPTKAEWLEALEADGLDIVQYIHPYTYIVWGEMDARNAAVEQAHVRWTGSFAPAYRLLPKHRGLPDQVDEVRVLMCGRADTAATVRAIEALGGKLGDHGRLNNIFEIAGFDLSTARLADVANLPGVYSVQVVPQDGGLRGEMSDQVCVNNVDGSNQAFPGYMSWLSGVGLDGTDVTMANVDRGIQDDHPDLVNRLTSCTGQTCGGSASHNHGTHTAGIMAADGASGTLDSYGFLRGLGVAPGATLVEQVCSPYYTWADGMLLLMEDSYRNGASLSNNSWGPSNSPQGYDNNTMQVDIGVRDADSNGLGNQPLSYILSIMNGYGGTSSQGAPDEAKNIFTIGSTKMQTSGGAQDLEINDISDNSAHGPCLDSRKIPHMVAPGKYVDSTITGSGYTLISGTSMASPHVSGAIALFIEYYRGLPSYSVDPSPALIKAAFLPVAHDLAGNQDADGGTLGHPFDSKQGWGRMDLEAVVDPQFTVRYFDDPVVFDNTGEEWAMIMSAQDPGQPMRIMLVWTDAPGHGLGGSTPAWNNDLDLIVESGADTYRGNDFGPSGWSQIGRSTDDRNNTEGVFIGPTAPDSYTLRVLASSINSDAIPGAGDGTDQDFALVCYNCAEEADFTVSASPAELDICTPDDAVYDVEVDSMPGFSNPITLSASGEPAGTTVNFSVNPVTPPGTSVMTIGNTVAASAGNYTIVIQGEDLSTSETKTTDVDLNVYTSAPGTVLLTAPSNGATGVGLTPTFEWSAATQAGSYQIDVAEDNGFATIVYTNTTVETSDEPDSPLDAVTQYYWHVIPINTCGIGSASSTYDFTTTAVAPILLVDDDDNDPNVRAYYTAALDALGLNYDHWDTNNSDNEPDAATLSAYAMVVWFTGDEWGGVAGPGPTSETSLSTYLDAGGCLFISSQDYYYDRGLTSFMSTYLGVSSATGDVSQTTVTGTGLVFSGFGPYSLSYPFNNYSDTVLPNGTAEVAFDGNVNDAAVDKDSGTYRTTFWGFPFEAVANAGDREALMDEVVDWCGASPPPIPGDWDDDGDVDLDDFAHFPGCMTGPDNGPAAAGCEVFYFDAGDDVDLADFAAFQTAFTGS